MRYYTMVVALLVCVSVASGQLQINVTLDDNPQVWSDVQKAVVNQAIQDWEDAFNAYDVTGTVEYSTQLINAGGGTLAQTSNWIWGATPPTGTDTRPWNGWVGHWMSVSPNLWWDPTPDTDDDVVGEDALTVIRHELGHVLGVWPGIYFDDYGTATHTDLWESQIQNNVFDPGGQNVPMMPDHGHVNQWGPLLHPYYSGGRIGVGETMEMFALAYDLQPIPEPASASLLLVGALAVLRRRR